MSNIMTSLKTFEEIGEYIEATKGITYLDNPKLWIDAIKDTVSSSRVVEAIDEVTGEVTQYFWTNIGTYNTPSATSGVKSLPSVPNVVTDLSTETAVAGDSAVATSNGGVFLWSTVGGVFAEILAGVGLGVASYELAPKFWTDLSNYVWRTNLTYEQTEPFLRSKVNAIMSTKSTSPKVPVTYIPEEIVTRTYDFLAQHMSDVVGYDFLVGTSWSAPDSHGASSIISGASHLKNVEFDCVQDLTDSVVQLVSATAYESAVSRGISVQGILNVDGIVNEVKAEYPNYNNADFYVIDVGYYPDSPFSYIINIDGYRLTNGEKAIADVSSPRSLHHYAEPPYNDSSYDYTLYNPTNYNKPLFSFEKIYNVDGTISKAIRDDGNTYRTFSTIWFNFHEMPSTNSIVVSTSTLNINLDNRDSYLKENGVTIKGGVVPTHKRNFQDQYADWYGNRKQIAQPSINKTDTVKNYLPVSIPLGHTADDKIIKHGVNQDENSYNAEQIPTQRGDDTPNINTIDDFNDNIQDTIRDYNDSRITPDSTPNEVPQTQPLPDYPTTPPTDTDFDDTPDTPETPEAPAIVGGTASGMVSVYNPTKQEIRDFSGWLWSPTFLDNFLKIFQNPMDAIIGLHILYATPPTTTPSNIIVGYLDSHVPSKVVSKQYTEFDCGTVIVPEYYGNATDYSPYTKVYCYLPFIGIVTLKTDDVMGKSVNIKYGVDVLTGTCLATITVTKNNRSIAMYTFTGNCAVQIPLSGGNYSRVITSLVGVVGSAMVGGAVGAIGAVGSALNAKLDVQHSGSIGSNAGAMGIRNPYLIITRTSAYDADSYNNFYGYPSNKTVTLSTCKGFTQVKNVHVDSIDVATENEKILIESMLKNGVIIN